MRSWSSRPFFLCRKDNVAPTFFLSRLLEGVFRAVRPHQGSSPVPCLRHRSCHHCFAFKKKKSTDQVAQSQLAIAGLKSSAPVPANLFIYTCIAFTRGGEQTGGGWQCLRFDSGCWSATVRNHLYAQNPARQVFQSVDARFSRALLVSIGRKQHRRGAK